MPLHTKLNIDAIRADFPILSQKARGKRLVYFDNAATSQKPQMVIDRIRRYYEEENANVHRAVHYLSERSTEAYEAARRAIAGFVNAPSAEQIVFTRGATEAINLVALSWGDAHLKSGDEMVVSLMEHHSNLVPWQMLAQRRGLTIKYLPVDEEGSLQIEKLSELITAKTRLLAVGHISNALGTVNPVKDLIEIAAARGIVSVIDGCQATPHLQIDLAELNPDFYAFSGHKMFGPTGIGILYGKAERLEEMPPLIGGGEMVDTVTTEGTTYKSPPYRFEAGTPHISGAIGLHSAVEYIQSLDRDAIMDWEDELKDYLMDGMKSVHGLRLIGIAKHKTCIQSFNVDGIHALDLGTFLDLEGIAVRTGNHCAQPLMARFGVTSTCRASLAFYNTMDEIDLFIEKLNKVITKLR